MAVPTHLALTSSAPLTYASKPLALAGQPLDRPSEALFAQLFGLPTNLSDHPEEIAIGTAAPQKEENAQSLVRLDNTFHLQRDVLPANLSE